jgi:hypothetical protein
MGLSILETGSMEKRMGLASFFMQMVMSLKVTLLMIKQTVKGPLLTQMAQSMRVTGLTISSMVRGLKYW